MEDYAIRKFTISLSIRQSAKMCFYAIVIMKCNNCDEELWTTTLKKRDCKKKSCDGVVPPGRKVKEQVKHTTDMSHWCHFPLVLSTEVEEAESDKKKSDDESSSVKKEKSSVKKSKSKSSRKV